MHRRTCDKRAPIGGRNEKEVEKAEEETIVEGNPLMPLKQPPNLKEIHFTVAEFSNPDSRSQ